MAVEQPAQRRASASKGSSGSTADEGAQCISGDERAAADADYRDTAGCDVAVDGGAPKACRLAGFIDAVAQLRGVWVWIRHRVSSV